VTDELKAIITIEMLNIVLATRKKVVEANYLIPFLQQSFAKMTSDEASPACNQNSFCHISLRERKAHSA
jgi:hypothetical protein